MNNTIRKLAKRCGVIFSVSQVGIIIFLLIQPEQRSILHITVSIVGLTAGLLVARQIRIGHVLYVVSLLLQVPTIVTLTYIGYGGIYLSMFGGRIGAAFKLFFIMVLGGILSLFYFGSLVVVVWDLVQNDLLAAERDAPTDANPDQTTTGSAP